MTFWMQSTVYPDFSWLSFFREVGPYILTAITAPLPKMKPIIQKGELFKKGKVF